MLIRRAALLDGTVADIRLGDAITEVGAALVPEPGEDVLDARGGAVVPGLHDHHVHLWATAASLSSVQVGPPLVRTPTQFERVLRDADVGPDNGIRAVGYHESVAGDLDRDALDAVRTDVPVRVQHRSGALWILNSAALAQAGVTGSADGRLFREQSPLPRLEAPPALGPLSGLLSSCGVTGVTEATPGYGQRDLETFSAARHSGVLRQRLHCMAIAGTVATPEVSVGPAKRILDDTDLDLHNLQQWVTVNHEHDHPVAVHCVTDAQLVVTIAALRAAGVHPRDRIEHAAMVPDDCVGDLRELGVTVVTQPNFIVERGDEYIADIAAADIARLWRVGSLVDAGVRIALSTDMPFGRPDPWAAVRAAVRRVAPGGVIIGAAERLSPLAALTMFFGHPGDPARARTVAAGQPGDLCVLAVPPAEALADLDADAVSATIIGGDVVYQDSVG